MAHDVRKSWKSGQSIRMFIGNLKEYCGTMGYTALWDARRCMCLIDSVYCMCLIDSV